MKNNFPAVHIDTTNTITKTQASKDRAIMISVRNQKGRFFSINDHTQLKPSSILTVMIQLSAS